jgi:hypothetical protein
MRSKCRDDGWLDSCLRILTAHQENTMKDRANQFPTIPLADDSVVGGLSDGFRFYPQPHHGTNFNLTANAAYTHAWSTPDAAASVDARLRDREGAQPQAQPVDSTPK